MPNANANIHKALAFPQGLCVAYPYCHVVWNILHQNNSISRNTAENYYEDVRTNVLQQYFMLTFTYNFKNFAEAKGK